MLKVAQKYIISFSKEKLGEISRFLAEKGVVEVIDQTPEESLQERLQEIDYKLASIDFVLSFLKPFAPQRSLIEKLKRPKILVKRDFFQRIAEQSRFLTKQIEEIEVLEKKIETLKQEKHQAQQDLKELEKFGDINFLIQSTGNCFCLVGEIKSGFWTRLEDFCLKNGLYQRALFYSPEEQTFLIIGLKEKKKEFLQFLEEIGGKVLDYSFKESPLQRKKKLIEFIKKREQELERCWKEVREKGKFFEKFKMYYDFLSYKKAQLQVQKATLKGSFLEYIIFWALPEDKKQLEKALKKKFPEAKDIQIFKIGVSEGEEQPVVLENKKMIAPFQYVTEIFGRPKANEIDPTPYLALFFIVFFGIAITDAGYGILLFLFMGLTLLFFRNLFKDTKLIELLLYGGVATFILGVLFGGFFGMSEQTLNKIPIFSKLKVIDPLKDTVLFMGLCFALGYLQIVFAEVVKIISAFSNKQKERIFNGFAWIGFYLAVLLLFLSFKLVFLKQIAIFATLISGLFLILVEGWGQKVFLIPLVGLIKVLQGVIGALSDVLSYSRLMALGLGTAVIALIVNQIAILFGGIIPYGGWLVAGLILVGGHIFNLGINALSGFIHSGRLQYVEFFPKFLEGGGRRFQPIKPEYKYIKVEGNKKQ